MKSIAERGKVTFSELFAQAASRSEVVCTFLAMLELIRLKQLVCTQPEPFAEIEITKSAVVPLTNAPEAPQGSEGAAVEPVPVAGAPENPAGAKSEDTSAPAETPAPQS
jgi:hypothetical protein